MARSGPGQRAPWRAVPARPFALPRARPNSTMRAPPGVSRGASAPTTPMWRLRPGRAFGSSSGPP
eukprot:7129130-Lingulodinium_polyedra.AAC.1